MRPLVEALSFMYSTIYLAAMVSVIFTMGGRWGLPSGAGLAVSFFIMKVVPGMVGFTSSFLLLQEMVKNKNSTKLVLKNGLVIWLVFSIEDQYYNKLRIKYLNRPRLKINFSLIGNLK